jgi:hypothetical protein
MNRKILIGIAGGALALALAGGAVYAGPSLERSFTATTQAASPTAQPTAATTARGQHNGKAAMLVPALIKGAADATGTQPKDVMAALRDGKSLAQYAQEHGKQASDIVQTARKNIQDRLNQAVSNGKLAQEKADALLKQFDDSAPKLVADTNLGTQIGRAVAKRSHAGGALVKATADVTGTKPQDVTAALRDGKSLAQYAQEHGKTADDILAKLRELGQTRLNKGLDRAKELINKPGLGRGGQPNSASPTAAPTK